MRRFAAVAAAAALPVLAGVSSVLAQAAPITLGTNPVDVQETVDNLWGFVASPLGILMAFGLVIAIIAALYKLAKRPMRGK